MRIVSLLLIFMIFSCTEKKTETKIDPNKSDNDFSYTSDSTYMQFTAYKFTEKLGVSGIFNTIKINDTQKSKNAFKVFDKSSFTIETSSLNTNNPARDETIIKHFFDHLIDTKQITGNVVSIDEYGKGTFNVTLNGISKDVDFVCTNNNNIIEFTSEINLEDFSGQEAIAKLNEACKLNHVGSDGIIKLWPTIKLYLKVMVK